MSTEFMSAVLAALNETAEVEEGDRDPSQTVPTEPAEAIDIALQATDPQSSETRFAAIVSSCMAKIRSARLEISHRDKPAQTV